MEGCKLHGVQRIKFPEADDKKWHDKVKFTKTEYQLPLRFVSSTQISKTYYVNKTRVSHCHQMPSPPNTSITPCGSCIYLKCSDGQYFKPPQVKMGDDGTEKFLDQVLTAATICRQHLANKIPMKRFTLEQWNQYKNATNCSIFPKPYKSTDTKVCGHDRLTSEYRGPAHNACNLNDQINQKKVKMHSMHYSQPQRYIFSIL